MIKICIDCNHEFEAKTSAKRCAICQTEFRKINNRQRALRSAYKSGRIKEPGVGSGNSSTNKNRPLSIQTYRRVLKDHCEECGKQRPRSYNPWEWCVHHKDENRYNNDPDNLITVCKSCHQRIHNAADHLNEAK